MKVAENVLELIGAGFVPQVLNLELIASIIPVQDEDAIETCCQLARQEGLPLGISSGCICGYAIGHSNGEREKDTGHCCGYCR